MILTEMCLQVSNGAGGSSAGVWDPPGALLACVSKCANAVHSSTVFLNHPCLWLLLLQVQGGLEGFRDASKIV